MLTNGDEYEPLTESIIGCGIKVHEYFGPGLLESVYQRCMVIELERAALKVNNGRRVPLVYREVPLDCVFVRISLSTMWRSLKSRRWIGLRGFTRRS